LVGIPTLQLLGDFFISTSGAIPYVIALDLKRKLRSRPKWWAFFMGLIGLAGNFTTLTASWLGFLSPGPEFLYFENLSRMLLGLSAALLVTDILNSSLQGIRALLVLVAAAPASSILLYKAQGGNPVSQEILIVQTVYFGFFFWICLSYYSLILFRYLEKITDTHFRPLTTSASVLYGIVGFVFLYAVPGYLYGVISPQDRLFLRSASTILGTIAGIILLNVALRLKIAIPKPVRVGRFEILPTGVREIDKEVGGIPYPAAILVMGPGGSGKTGFVSQFCATRLEAGDSIAWFCLEYSAEYARGGLRISSLNVDMFERDDRLILVDCYLPLSGIKPSERFSTSTNLTDISIMITKTMELLKGQRKWLMIDSMSSLVREHGIDRILKFLSNTAAKLAVAKAGLICTVNNKALSELELAIIQEQFHGNIQLDIFEERGRLRRRMRIVKMPTVKGSGKWCNM